MKVVVSHCGKQVGKHPDAEEVVQEVFADAISSYGGLWGGSESKKEDYENRQGRMGATLWEKPDYYIENSPVLLADRIETPLLMMHNKKDGNVSFSQGIEFFTALRRLGKKAWMLQYDDNTHGLNSWETFSTEDYTIRMTQFFDHYLKQAPAPIWMLDGIPAKMKGVDNGLQLDTTGRKPGPGLLIQMLK